MPKIDVTKTELARPGKYNIDYWGVDWGLPERHLHMDLSLKLPRWNSWPGYQRRKC